MYTDEHGYRTADAPPGWPFGRLTPEQMRAWERAQERADAEQALRDAEPALM